MKYPLSNGIPTEKFTCKTFHPLGKKASISSTGQKKLENATFYQGPFFKTFLEWISIPEWPEYISLTTKRYTSANKRFSHNPKNQFPIMKTLLDDLARQHYIESKTREEYVEKDAQTPLSHCASVIIGTDTRSAHPETYHSMI